MKEIFVLEDDSDIRELIEYLLEDQEYKVEAFPTAAAFNEKIASHLPDLFLLDIMLPDGNGIDICEKLKSEASTSSIPVVLMSAHLGPSAKRENCPDDFISKPFDIEDFTTRIARQL